VSRRDGDAAAARDRAGGVPRWLTPVALAGSVAALGLRVLAMTSAGPLWRDEACSASTAGVASFADFWSRLALDSFPLLWQLLLRVWTTVLWNGGDAAIRTLGLVIGAALVPALWWTSRALGVVPLASTLAALTPLLVMWSGVQSRAYGLAVVLLALLTGVLWRVVERASLARIAGATVIGLLAVHTTYHLPVMLAALLAGVAAVGLVRRDRGLVVIALGIGTVCAASLLAYAGTLARTREYSKVVYANVTLDSVARGLRIALAPGGALGVAVVVAATVCCAYGAIVALRVLGEARTRDARVAQVARRRDPAAEAVLFAATAGIVAVLAQGPFLLSLRFLVQPWYYSTVVVVLAIALDVVLQRTLLPERLRTAGLAALAVLLAVAVVPSATAVAQRQSNLDLVAAYLKQNARPGDLIVVYPWHYGVSFQRYYDGAVPFMTVPDIEGHDHYRYDQLAELMRDPERIKPGFRRIFQTLQTGGGVWVVGAPATELLPQFPVPSVPSDDDPLSWNDNRYSLLAGLQLRWVLQQGAAQAFPVPPLTDRPVRDYEDAPLTLYSAQPR
jgi:hypothetical protein